MEAKAKWDVDVGFILGITFAFMGAVYLGIAVLLFFSPVDPESAAVRAVLLPLGSGFFLAGMALLIRSARKKRQADRLIAHGRYIWGTVAQLQPNAFINGLHGNPVVAIVHVTDGSGQLHIFRSRHLHRPPDASILGKPVKVYIQSSSYTPYYVDMEPLLPNKR